MASKFKNSSLIGNRIREHREKLNLTRPELAKAVDVSLSALQGWEMNEREPQASMIIKIAETLNVSPNYLLTGEIEKQSHSSTNINSLTVDEAFIALKNAVSEVMQKSVQNDIELSSEEKQIILNFRRCNQEQKQAINMMINTMVSTSLANIKPSNEDDRTRKEDILRHANG
ncbi:helix-turn-helix domain-containing protein [Volucribacter amazonae]|uniref:HTH cro/C1-type domain-containing protein n=1 Tax=Volucribacter amazonae TaxID=256731 RepID=A0A9X4PCE3_9PAST|nr:helix-turn-helix domain-containing protein [Volucribacter amazonae]MDG6895074.1 hypothetical protein [Volucribacter amazonae]